MLCSLAQMARDIQKVIADHPHIHDEGVSHIPAYSPLVDAGFHGSISWLLIFDLFQRSTIHDQAAGRTLWFSLAETAGGMQNCTVHHPHLEASNTLCILLISLSFRKGLKFPLNIRAETPKPVF